MSRISTRSKILFGIGLALALQGVNGYLAYQATTEYLEAAAERRASALVLQTSAEFLSMLMDAESGVRGYLLTGEETFLEPYHAATSAIGPAFREFQNQANVRYAADLAAVAPLLERELADLRAILELYRDPTQGPQAATARAAAGVTRNDMQAMRRILDQIDRNEQARLDQYMATTDRLSRTTLISVLSVSTLAMFLVAVAGTLVYIDLKKRMQIEDQLREQKSILQSILDSMADAVIVADPDRKLSLVNAAAQRMHGDAATDAPPEQWSSVFGLYQPDTTTPYPADELPLVRVLRGEHVDQSQLYLRRKSGEGTYQDVSGRPIFDDEGKFRGGVIVSRDVTKQKAAEREIRRINEELEERVRHRTLELAASNAELLQKNQENEMFVYSVSHDLRSPLVNLQGFSRELSLACDELRTLLVDAAVPAAVRDRGRQILDEDVTQAVQFIQTAVMRLAGIINALLRLSRAGRIEYQFQTVAMKTVVERILTAQNSILSARGVSTEVGELPNLWGDPTAVEQLFANIIENAVKYLDPARPGRIVVDVAPADTPLPPDVPENCCVLMVRDNGLGIPGGALTKIFNAFERCHPEVAPGDGMGLAIVGRIVNRHGGKIWARSVVGRGSTFYIALPREAAPQAHLPKRPAVATP